MRTTIIILLLSLLISCTGKKQSDTAVYNGADANSTALLEQRFTQTADPLEKFILLDQIAKEKAKVLTQVEFADYFIEFRRQINNIMGEIYSTVSEQIIDEEWIEKNGKSYTDAGLQFVMSEGMINIIQPRDGYYAENFERYLPKEYVDFFRIELQETNGEYSIIEDASLLVEHKTLGKLVLDIEDFMRLYPQSKLINDVKEKYLRYQDVYVNGIDNSPVRTANGMLLPKIRAEFNRFIKENPNSLTTPLLQEQLQENG